MTPPVISVVLPCRDGAERLPATLAAIRAETDALGAPVELVLVDDRSADATAAVAQRIAAGWPALRLVTGPGRGPGAARNAGVDACRGALVAFADDDDAWAPGRLVGALAAHRARPGAVFSCQDYAHARAEAPGAALPTAFAYWPLWRAFRGAALTEASDARALIAAENAVGTSTVTLRRVDFLAVGGFDEALPSASDWDLWLKLARRGPALILGGVGAIYAMRPGSVSAARSARIAAMRAVLARHPDLPIWARRRAEARLATARSEAAAQEGRGWSALGHAARALALVPARPQARRLAGLIGALP
jgi:glycosyltransferase involved in cell wall biosynthesis